MSRMIAPLLLLLAMTWPTAALGQQMPDAPDVPLTQDPLYRGDVFYYEGDFYRAITQYEIYLMGQPPKDAADAARLKIGWLYAQADKLPAAAEQLSEGNLDAP